jgi:hypothetical protein
LNKKLKLTPKTKNRNKMIMRKNTEVSTKNPKTGGKKKKKKTLRNCIRNQKIV